MKENELLRSRIAELETAEEKVTMLSHQTLIGVHIIRDGRLIYVSKATSIICGYSEKEIMSWAPDEFTKVIHPEDLGFVSKQAAKKQHGDGGVVANYEWRLITKTGDEKWIESFSETIRTPDGPANFVMMLDVTARKKTEQELHRLRDLLSSIVNSMPSVLVGVTKNGTVSQWNREAELETGIRETDACGQSLQEVFPALWNEIDKARADIAKRKPYKNEKVARKIKGKVAYSDITIFPLISDGKEGAVIRIDDVTNRVQIEEMIIQSEKMLSLGGLAAGMAHEINNPLAGILQNMQVINNRIFGDLPANEQEAQSCGITLNGLRAYMASRGINMMFEAVMNSGLRASKIVENMLNFSRKDNLISNCNLPELIDKTIELAANDYNIKKKYDFKRIVIEYDYSEDLPIVACEAGKMQQVFFNLMKNGAQAMNKNEHRPGLFKIKLTPDRLDSNAAVKIEFEDNGPGMDEATSKRVFEPFFTTKGVGEGTGLGLSVSYFIVTENHGGTMSVSSTPGQGTKFTIKIPVIADVSRITSQPGSITPNK